MVDRLALKVSTAIVAAPYIAGQPKAAQHLRARCGIVDNAYVSPVFVSDPHPFAAPFTDTISCDHYHPAIKRKAQQAGAFFADRNH
jgi:hypothetical protein